jgi:TP901 family phage tail tape measure protein
MVDARLEVLIVAKDQFRRVLRGINETVNRVRTGVRALNRERTNRLQTAFVTLRNRARQVGAAIQVLGQRLRAINRVTFGRAIAGFRALRASMRGATAQAGALRGALAPFIGAAALILGIISATRVLAGFGQQMAAVRAITGATEQQFALLEEEARRLGATTRFTAQQAADGLEFLARAGFSAEDATEALEGTLNLASAGMLDLASSADIVSNVIQQFGLDTDQTNRVVDVLATTAANSNTNVLQLGDAFKFVGPIARALNIDVEDTSELLGLLGNAGIQASNAGAGLRRAFFGLINTTPKAEKALAELELTTEDVRLTGENTADVFRLLGERGLTAAQAVQIFGIRGSTVALSLAEAAKQGNSLAEAIANSEGEAKRISEVIEDTLIGDFRRLISAFQEVILQAGESGLTGGLRTLLRGLTTIVQALDGTAETADKVGGAFGAIAKAVAAVITIFETLSELGVVERILSPLVAALENIAELIEGIAARFRELGAIPADTADAVTAGVDIIRKKFKDLSDLSALEAFIAGQKTILQGFNVEIVALQKKLGEDLSREDRAQTLRRLQALRTSQQREVGIIVGANVLRRELIAAGGEEETAARKVVNDKSIADITADNEARLALLEERVKLSVIETAREVAAFKNAAAEISAIDKQRAAAGLAPLQDGLRARQDLLERALDAEIAAQRAQIGRIAEIAELRVAAAPTEDVEGIRTAAAAELIKAETKLNALISQQVIQSADFGAQTAKAATDLTRLVQAATRVVAGTTVVQDFTAIRERLEADFNKTIRNLTVSADQAKIFEKALDVRAADEAIRQVEEAVRASNERLSRDEELLAAQRATRQITQREFIDRTAEAQARSFEEQLEFVRQLQELDPGLFSQEQLDRITLLEARIIQLREVITPEIEALTSAFQRAGEEFFQDLISGTLTAEEAFKKFAQSIIAQIQKIIIQQLVLKAVQASSGGIGAIGAAITARDGGFIQKFGAGGPVKGPGSGRSDSVPARLSAGEFVMPEHITRNWRGVLEVMRAGRFGAFLKGQNINLRGITVPRLGRFQGGGVVEPPQTTTAGGEQRSIRIINSIDPSLLNNFLSSSEGEQVLLNIIGRNPENIKRILA